MSFTTGGRFQCKASIEEFGMTPMKVRKLLIMSGAYETEISMKVNELYQYGKTIPKIQKIMRLSRSSVHGYELDAIAAVVIGGTSLSGGIGTISGTVIGAFIMSVLTNGLKVMAVPQQWQTVIIGGVRILSVLLDMIRKKQGQVVTYESSKKQSQLGKRKLGICLVAGVLIVGVIIGRVTAKQPTQEVSKAEGVMSTQEEIMIPVIAKGFQHQFWQAVKMGAEQAAQDLGVKVTFEGTETEDQIDKQLEMLQAALAKRPQAIALAALDSSATTPYLEQAQGMNIPVIGFDSGKTMIDAIRQGVVAGSITQDPIGIGYKVVEAAYRAYKGEENPELMKVMMEMGYGDEIVLADGNFPAAMKARQLIRCDGYSVLDLLEAILPFFPLDTYVQEPIGLMAVVEGDNVKTDIWDEYKQIISKHEEKDINIEYIERFEFYKRAEQAYAIVATSEKAQYANIILKKGVVINEE